ncbi:C4-dicarboxylate ABC transporter [Nitrosomonas supralitoralis]|uniref:C4-dicarboxylate ABC transporter n=1 Tax=Nitrosomonas supralitoralis TaxID=2116706 RepID=A0A2P7NYA1_9PROT|nr:C4-dicarboxylate ABC transporter [Nitrosomonas supralitoralis]PSJ18417.1 C4-dicarboxylate ABC transporter [Nitrosomonas supralitoralis]
MTDNHFFAIAALVIIGIFFGIVAMLGLPQSILEWVITDGAFAILLYISYLAIGAFKGTSKPRMHY